MMLEHHELRSAMQDLLNYHQGFYSVHERLVRLVKGVLLAFSQLTNGHRFWMRSLPQKAKTALIVLNEFMRSKGR